MSGNGKRTLVSWLGFLGYSEALDLQMRITNCKKQGMVEDVLLLLEHPPTVTLGRNGKWHNLIASESVLRSRGVCRFEVDRGGDITFHGPGQLVGYPILKLESAERDVHRYMRNLEETIIRLLAAFGVVGERQSGLTGVWTGQGKIAAMGVHLSRWITRHGFALNVNTDLSFFDLIIPCGISGARVTSMGTILGRLLDLGDVASGYTREFESVFQRELCWLTRADLDRVLEGVPVEQGRAKAEVVHLRRGVL